MGFRHVAPDESEYWMARELQSVLGYDRWENFAEAISRAMDACASADVVVENHFRETTKMVNVGSGAKRATEDWSEIGVSGITSPQLGRRVDHRLHNCNYICMTAGFVKGIITCNSRKGTKTAEEFATPATLQGWRVLRVTPKQIADGSALTLVEKAIRG